MKLSENKRANLNVWYFSGKQTLISIFLMLFKAKATYGLIPEKRREFTLTYERNEWQRRLFVEEPHEIIKLWTLHKNASFLQNAFGRRLEGSRPRNVRKLLKRAISGKEFRSGLVVMSFGLIFFSSCPFRFWLTAYGCIFSMFWLRFQFHVFSQCFGSASNVLCFLNVLVLIWISCVLSAFALVRSRFQSLCHFPIFFRNLWKYFKRRSLNPDKYRQIGARTFKNWGKIDISFCLGFW